MPKVSIVVPIYNVEKYLDECLKSIQKQSLKDIEVICVDDGSTDGSLDIVKKFADRDKRFTYITKKNAGYGDTMNRGFDAATGEYIGIVESDDYIYPEMFRTLYLTAKQYCCEVVKSDYYEFTTTQKKKQRYINTPINPQYYDKVLNYKNCKDLFHFKMNTWTGIYLRQFIADNDIKHNTTPGAAYQDNGFWFQTLSLAEKIVFINKAFYHYRQDNPNSSINSKGKVFCMCDEYAYIESFLNCHENIHDDLYSIFLVKKYYNYMYTYGRISDEFKIKFLERFADEFRAPLKDNLLTVENAGAHIMQMLRRIVKNPAQFYYEDTIWDLQHRIVDLMLKTTKIHEKMDHSVLHAVRRV